MGNTAALLQKQLAVESIFSSTCTRQQHRPVPRGREVADAAYAQLVAAMCAQLERTAAADPKHGERLRLENYAFLADVLRPLAARVPVLGRFAARAGHARDVALAAYVRQQLEYGRFWRLLQLSQARCSPFLHRCCQPWLPCCIVLCTGTQVLVTDLTGQKQDKGSQTASTSPPGALRLPALLLAALPSGWQAAGVGALSASSRFS